MKVKKKLAALTLALIISAGGFQPAYAYTQGALLKQGLSNQDVSELQRDLKQLGYFSLDVTGYFGSVTKASVINFQRDQGLVADGIAGAATIGKLTELVSAGGIEKPVSRSGSDRTESVQLLSWFGMVKDIFARGDIATLTDVNTGLKLQIKRTYGGNHADVEALTKEDTAILKEIAGGSWNWTRRPVIIEVDGYKIAGSMTAMPHAGLDSKAELAVVDNRSGGFGTGQNLDAVKGNGMDGHFDVHFLDSRTHSTNKVDSKHQEAIQKAYKSGQ
ncbi:peptidoglycan-binding domain-containing protein [Acidaminobacter hydrogenoformans]|uniref:Putative peptidoglycan binding domain-containing protein n=1 Tax=Acidaminobacter hydrogenoformans DSM 2784 TaxID=1120920 RepID=A0A1G5S0M6_9FIRM|nr:peptidoglycan-binding domain-containing protein [Acidaminobacter hydrogenoformans]SCZ79836.1 Putative peptidoglycan binding domain-containing protein [Acidaminobacter hydrogenoformans DSM 2784]